MYSMDHYFPTYQFPYIAYPHTLPPPPQPPLTMKQADTTSAHNTIGWVLEELDKQVTKFKFPTRLAFAEPSSDGQIPRLAKARMNQPLAEHRSSLEYLLDVLGGVQPHGDRGIKAARADAIQRVRSELAELKLKKAAAWRNQLRRDAWPLWSGW
ncbi:hypothetical protein FRC06_010374 [Ceratobasidium sp. 370]|nr:hypothetical protein FRC06_010374 [Ceratobasidium sp. 370]